MSGAELGQGKQPEADWVGAALARWVDAGLIRRDQAQRIVSYERGLNTFGVSVPTVIPAVDRATPRPRRDIDLGSVIMYIGAFLVLFALTIFVGVAWDSMSRGAQFTWALVAVAGLNVLGALLRGRVRSITGGNLLIFAATGAVPLLVYTFQRLVGWWPEESSLTYADYHDRILAVWITMEVVSILATVAIMWRIRFSLLMLLVGFWSWYLSMDLGRWLFGLDRWEWTQASRWLGAAMGLAMVGVAVLLYRRSLREYGMWLALFGQIVAIGNLGALAIGDEQPPARLLFPLLALASFVVGAWLQARVFVVFGAIALYCWVSYIVFDVLGTGLGVTFGLVIIGVVILGTGVLYQRAVEPWLSARFGHGA